MIMPPQQNRELQLLGVFRRKYDFVHHGQTKDKVMSLGYQWGYKLTWAAQK